MEPGGRLLHAPGNHGPAGQPYPPAPKATPGPPDGHCVGGGRHLAPRQRPLLPLAVGAAPLAAHQGMVSGVEILPRRPQQMEAIPEPTAETPTEPNLCPIFAIHQVRALALGGQLQPAIRTETEARAAHAALVHEIFSALRSALVRRTGNPPGP